MAFFLLVGVSCLLAFGSLVLLRGTDRSSNAWVPVVGLVLMGGMAAIVTPVLAGARAAASHAMCLSNVKQIVTAFHIYSADWDDRMPNASHWQDQLGKYGEHRKCPKSDLPYSYAMNHKLSQALLSNIKNPEKTVLIFECWSGERNHSGETADLQVPHNNRGTVGFVGGTAILTGKENREIIWNP